MIRNTIIAVFALAIWSVPVQVEAQSGGFSGASTRLGFGPRAMSMSNALSANSKEGIYPYYNPALAALQLPGAKQIDLSVSSMEFDRVYQSLGASFNLPPRAGISFGILRTGVNDFDARSLSGYPLDRFDLSEYQLFTAFGIQLSKKLNAGIGFKLNYANYHPDLNAVTSVGMDLGVLYQAGSHFNLALAVQDLFSEYTWNSSSLYNQTQSRNIVQAFPTRLKMALSYDRDVFSLTGEFELQSQTAEVERVDVFVNSGSTPGVIRSLENRSSSSRVVRVGGAWRAHSYFTLRTGYRIMDLSIPESGSFSAGFSVHLPFDTFAPSIDYAFVMEPYRISNMHVFALRLNL